MIEVSRTFLIFLFIAVGGLSIALLGILGFALFLSMTINVILIAIVRSYAKDRMMIDADVAELYDELESLDNHLERINGMNRYYGDETINGLMLHIRTTQNRLHDIQESFGTEYLIEEQLDDEDEDGREEQVSEEEGSL
jgi:hypothetical protein